MSRKTEKSEKIKDLLTKRVEEITDRKSLEQKLLSGKKLRIKHGMDPTGPKIHLGRAIPLRKLRDFQDMGHKIVLIIGDFTAQIGDASDKNAMRRALTEKEIKENMKDYKNQIGVILDLKKTEIRYNSEWFKRLNIKELLALSMRFTAQQMIERRNFKERWDSHKPIGLHELFYPVLQGYDSVAVKADVEIGGYDQLFNLQAGREIQRIFGQKPQDIITCKMLLGLDGRKMSTSWGNIISIVDKPDDMFGKTMSMKDELILPYLELCTNTPSEKIEKIEKAIRTGKINPRNAKAELARKIVELYHGEKSAEAAEKEFEKIFKEKKTPSIVPVFKIKKKEFSILDILTESNTLPSKNEARRLIEQGGLKIDGKVWKEWKKKIKIDKEILIQAGKRKFLKVKKN